METIATLVAGEDFFFFINGEALLMN